jgi:hypothetical protein
MYRPKVPRLVRVEVWDKDEEKEDDFVYVYFPRTNPAISN